MWYLRLKSKGKDPNTFGYTSQTTLGRDAVMCARVGKAFK
jgi:hypothetical protein